MSAARVLVALAALAAAGPAAGEEPAAPATSAAAGQGPVELVRALYARDSVRAYDLYSARLRALFEADERAAEGGTGNLDFAFHLCGQDASEGWEQTLAFELVGRGERHATVRVTFVSFKEAHELHYALVREKGRWLIDDVRSFGSQRWVLSRILKGDP
jgi:hypothetical protein